MGNPMAIILFTFAVQKDRFGRFEKGHSFKKPRDDRGLELAKSWRNMSNKKFITWEVQGSEKSNCEKDTPRGRHTSTNKQNKFEYSLDAEEVWPTLQWNIKHHLNYFDAN